MNQEQAGQMQNLFEEMGQKFQEEANKTQQNDFINKKRNHQTDQYKDKENKNQNINNENNDEGNCSNSNEEIIDLNSLQGYKQEKNNENENFEKNENDSSSNDKIKETKYDFGIGENVEIKETRFGFSLEMVSCGLVIRFKTFKLPRHAKAVFKYIKANERFLSAMSGTEQRKVWVNNLFNYIKCMMVEN